MSRARIVKTAASLAALGSLIVVAIAGAAAWQGPVQVSPGDAGDAAHPPTISMGASGVAGAGWWDPANIIVARKLAGQPWSAPIAIGNPVVSTSLYQGVDAAGNVTTSWTGLAGLAIVSDWPVSAPSAHSEGIATMAVNDLVVNATGVAVLAGTSGNDVIVAYRPAGGAWSFHTFPGGGAMFAKPRLAVNAAGTAVVIFRDAPPGTGLWASVRTAAGDWGPLETVTALPVFDTPDANPSVAIDGAGNVFAAFAYTLAAGTTVVRTSLRPPGGGWQESPDLSETTAGFQANYVSVVVNPAGFALLVWEQFMGAANIQARYGSTGTGIWGPIETVNDAGADVPVAAIGNDGSAVVAWERQVAAGNNIGQARVREPGASGAFGDIRVLSTSHANVTRPSIATDGIGDFATISTPYDGIAKRALVSAYDAAPPTLSDIVVSGSQLAGDPVELAVTPSDAWSSVGTPVWTFSDGGSVSGTSATHTLANAGSFTAHVAVSDASGNSASKDISVSVFSSVSSLTTAKFSATWKMSRIVKGTLLVEGTVPRAGNYTIDATLGKQRKMHTTLKLPAGKFSSKLKLPQKLVPGTYRIDLVPDGSQVRPATQNAKLKAPREGVISRLYTSATRSGQPSRTLVRARNVYATFFFAALPAGNVTVRWFHLIGKKRIALHPIIKERMPKIVTSLGPFNLKGTYQVVILLKKVPIATTKVTITR